MYIALTERENRVQITFNSSDLLNVTTISLEGESQAYAVLREI